LKNSTIGVTLEPLKVDFANSTEKIVDLACGFNHCVAITENKQVYVWGKRMGLYPQFEFSHAGV
jgi:alpha-tubulin suppressor-like RCC1 family protein